MRKVFDDEVAQELGYQKHWPEKKDWTMGLVLGIIVAVAFVGIVISILKVTGNWDRQFKEKTCADYANYSIKDLPAKCAAQYGVSNLTK